MTTTFSSGAAWVADFKGRLAAAGISQGQVAREAGRPATHLSRIVSGRHKNPRLDTIHRYEAALERLLLARKKSAE